ncbi:hypothetical protein GWK47_044205 [Chionoecetes opilio]|uniref:Gag-like protein n=1 Tax=Chionoecetes opilio TaxID=41210 RepID=A0A8J5CZ76_CHIOP|nr:hypothetical protein GWK47_044205 [Chionoecetes opilio]
MIVHEEQPPAKLTRVSWGTYTLRPTGTGPVRCYKCQRLKPTCMLGMRHSVRCGVCSLTPREVCIGRHKAKEATTAKCPNCGRKHHAWNPQCPERLRRMPQPRLQQQLQAPRWRQLRHHETRGQPQQQQRQHRFIPAPLPARPAWVKAVKQPSPLVPMDPTPGRGSGGRESEAQLPVSVEEAATITPAAIPPPPHCLIGRLGPGPAHHTGVALKVTRPASHLQYLKRQRLRQREPRDVALPHATATTTFPSARRRVQLLIASSST